MSYESGAMPDPAQGGLCVGSRSGQVRDRHAVARDLVSLFIIGDRANLVRGTNWGTGSVSLRS